MSPCYYCGSKHHTVRQCFVDWREFVVWEDMFNIEVGYWGEINCNTLWSLKKKNIDADSVSRKCFTGSKDFSRW